MCTWQRHSALEWLSQQRLTQTCEGIRLETRLTSDFTTMPGYETEHEDDEEEVVAYDDGFISFSP